MDNEYPLYPAISEEGKREAERLIEGFKVKLKRAADEVLSDLYVDIPAFIESDSWGNFRNTIMDGFKNYANRKRQNEWNFAEIRAEIFKQFHDDIINDLNKDLVEENSKLKKEVERLEGWVNEHKRY